MVVEYLKIMHKAVTCVVSCTQCNSIVLADYNSLYTDIAGFVLSHVHEFKGVPCGMQFVLILVWVQSMMRMVSVLLMPGGSWLHLLTSQLRHISIFHAAANIIFIIHSCKYIQTP